MRFLYNHVRVFFVGALQFFAGLFACGLYSEKLIMKTFFEKTLQFMRTKQHFLYI